MDFDEYESYDFDGIPEGKKAICRRCAYFTHQFVAPEGPKSADIFLCGDSPWQSERREGRPFRGPAGQVLDACLEEVGINRGDIYVTNSVKCVPAKLGEPHPAGVEDLCREHFLKGEIEEIQPRVVVPMGNIALKAIVKDRGSITKVRGTFQDVDFFEKRITILPTFHPSYILRNPSHVDYLINDLKMVANIEHPAGQQFTKLLGVHYRHIDTLPKFERFWNIIKDAKELSWDIETTKLDVRGADILSMNISCKERESFVITFFKEIHTELKNNKQKIDAGSIINTQTFNIYVIRKLWSLLHSGKVIYFHNGKFDLKHMHHWFERNIYRGVSIDRVRWYDTQGMQGLLNENMRQGLKEISSIHTDIRYSRDELDVVHGGKLTEMPLSKLVHYGSMDSDATFRIAKKFSKNMFDEGLWYGPFVGKDYSDMTVANTLFKMELFGAPIDSDKLFEIRHIVEGKLKSLYKIMEHEAGHEFNPRSTDQLRNVLFDVLNFPDTGIHTGKGKISTNKESIDILFQMQPDDPFLKSFKLYRQYDAIYKTFINGFDKRLWDDNRLRPDFSFTKTVSGRVVCYDPNILNIPRDKEFEEGILLSVRDMFAARPGWKIVLADSMQVEFKCCAYVSQDQRLIEDIFENHEDFHDLIAKSAYPWYADLEARVKRFEGRAVSGDLQKKIDSAKIKLKDGRTKAKNFNFGWMFGGETSTLATALGVTEDQVQIFTGRIENRYPKFWKYVKSVGEIAVQTGVIVSPFMRKRRIPPTPDERTQSELGRKASNFNPQSSAAYVCRAALTRIGKRCEQDGLKGYLFNIVYDGIFIECPDDEVVTMTHIMVEEMLRPVPEMGSHIFSVEAGSGNSWRSAEAHAKKYYSVNDLEEK